jgi:hypothetical protein
MFYSPSVLKRIFLTTLLHRVFSESVRCARGEFLHIRWSSFTPSGHPMLLRCEYPLFADPFLLYCDLVSFPH